MKALAVILIVPLALLLGVAIYLAVTPPGAKLLPQQHDEAELADTEAKGLNAA